MNSDLKKRAAIYAVDHFVTSDMVVGLGVGSTAIHAIRHIAQKLQQGSLQNVKGIPCGKDTQAKAEALGIPLTTLEQHPHIAVTIDGADEVSPSLDLIKGGGGALLREKIVAQATQTEVIVVDESKLSPTLGINWALPIEVIPFGLGAHQAFLESLGGKPTLRLAQDGTPYQTDDGHYILDTDFGRIDEPQRLAAQLCTKAGIVEHGLFLELATVVVVAGHESEIRVLKRAFS